MTCVVLDRPRHADLIRQIREAGARIALISDGDVAGSIMVSVGLLFRVEESYPQEEVSKKHTAFVLFTGK